MTKKIKAVIFDLDGTLLDTLTGLTASVNASMRAHSMPEHTKDEVCAYVGEGVYKLMERAVPEGRKNAQYTSALEYFKEHYAIHMYDNTDAYPGIRSALAALKNEGYRLAVVSNKFDLAVVELCRRYFSEYIEVAAGENEAEGIRKKPAPDTVFAALSKLGCSADEAVYIGDSDVDVHTAKNAGMPCISVLWGFRGKDFLLSEGADLFARDADELIEMIHELG